MDRETSFTGELVQRVLMLQHHRPLKNNGKPLALEWAIKTPPGMVSMYVDVERKPWDEILHYVTFAYNTDIQETTHMTVSASVQKIADCDSLSAVLSHVTTSR